MNVTYKIARAELRNLFYSPVAWFLTIAFFVQCALHYLGFVDRLVGFQDSMKGTDVTFNNFGQSLTYATFVGDSGVFNRVIQNLYLFIPLLTMGIISREFSAGTMKLLTSSPIKVRHIVLGKYLAMMIFNLVFIGCIGVLVVSGWISIEEFEFGFVIGALLGTYILICAYSAIGVFMSSLTTYQIVSAVAIFLTIFLLNHVGRMWQQYDFVRDLTYFLSIAGRSNSMLVGLISSKDVIYFLLIIGLFLSFTILKIKGTMESRSWYFKASRYVFCLVIVLTIGYISHRPANTFYLDITRNKVNTIHPNTQEIIKNFEKGEPLKVTLYTNLLGDGYDRSQTKMRNFYFSHFWERYLRFKPDIEFDYVHYYDVMPRDSSWHIRFPNKDVHEIADLYAKSKQTLLSRFLKPEEIRALIDLEPEKMRTVMQLEYKGRKTFLRTFSDIRFWPGEINVSAAFARLQLPDMPKILYTTGDLERSITRSGEREFSFLTTALQNRESQINIGFDVDTINLDHEDLPEGISYLVVADPKTNLSETKKRKIRAFIERGGNVQFMSEPGKQEILNPILEDLGVELGKGTLVQVTEDRAPTMLQTAVPASTLELSEYFKHTLESIKNGEYVSIKDQAIPGASAVILKHSEPDKGFKVHPLFITEPKRNTFSRVGKLVVDSVAPKYEPEIGDYKKSQFDVMVGLSRPLTGKEQRIFVSGDADYFSNLRNAGGIYGIHFTSWLANNEFPIFAPTPDPKDSLFKTDLKAMKFRYYAYVWIIPSLLLVFASIMLIRRKRK